MYVTQKEETISFFLVFIIFSSDISYATTNEILMIFFFISAKRKILFQHIVIYTNISRRHRWRKEQRRGIRILSGWSENGKKFTPENENNFFAILFIP